MVHSQGKFPKYFQALMGQLKVGATTSLLKITQFFFEICLL